MPLISRCQFEDYILIGRTPSTREESNDEWSDMPADGKDFCPNQFLVSVDSSLFLPMKG